jgi:hypothetical protein
MNGKWTKYGLLAVAFLVGLLALGTVVSAQGPGQGPQPSDRGRGPWGMGGFGGPQNSLVAVAAQVLGIDQPTLVATLNSGKTIADVAKDKGVALDKIVDAFVAERAEALKSAVAAGRLTQAQADAWLSTMKTNVTAQLNEKFTPRGFGMGMGFADEDHDGVCDHCGMGMNQSRMPRGRWSR